MTNRRNICNQGGYIETRWIYTKEEKGTHNNSTINDNNTSIKRNITKNCFLKLNSESNQ